MPRTVSLVAAAAIAACSVTPTAASAATEQVIHVFKSGNHDGQGPSAPLVFDDAGALLYGVTGSGGHFHGGALYSITPQGVETVLHSFGARGDGAVPQSSVTFLAGTLYGTTYYGQTDRKRVLGAVWTLSSTGTYQILHDFQGSPDGEAPEGGLTNFRGDLYGSTSGGGANGDGSIYRMTPSGHLKILYSFTGGTADGAEPWGNLVELGGRLYGTTRYGGAAGVGTVFEITPAGVETVLYSFKGPPDGANPRTGLMVLNGALYGTTDQGGSHGRYCGVSGCGTVFKVTLAGVETVLHSFAGGEGALPVGGLTSIGKVLYGTTSSGGAGGEGVAYSMTLRGHETVLHDFAGGYDGAGPYGLVSNSAGSILFGATGGGGSVCGCGIVYSITPTP